MLEQDKEQAKHRAVINIIPMIQQALRSNDKTEDYDFNIHKLTHIKQNVVKLFSEARSQYYIVKYYSYDEIEPEQTRRIIHCISEIRQSNQKELMIAVQNIVNIDKLLKDKETMKNFVQIEDDVGEQDLHYYFHSLAEPLPKETVFDFMYSMTRALALCQLNKIYHRDVKPSNFILMRGVHDEPLIKLIDFNISKVLRTTTGVTHNKGTMSYWSYERFKQLSSFEALKDEAYKFEHDAYSLGITFLQLLAAGTPLTKPLRKIIQEFAKEEIVMTIKTKNLLKVLEDIKNERNESWEDVIFLTQKLITPLGENRGDFLTVLGFLKKVVRNEINNQEQYKEYFKEECRMCQDRRKSHKNVLRHEQREGYLIKLTKFDVIIDPKLSHIEFKEVPEFNIQPNQIDTIPYLNLRDKQLYIFNYQNKAANQTFKLEQKNLPIDATILYNQQGFLGIYGGGYRIESFRPNDAHYRLNFQGELAPEKKLPNNGHSQTAGVFVSSSIVFLIGGMNGDGAQDKSCIWFDYKESKEWSQGPGLNYPRLHPGAVCVGQSIFVLGGVWSQGAQSLDVDQIFYHQKKIECFNRADAFPRWIEFDLQMPNGVLSVQSPFTIPLDNSHFIMFGGRRYKYLKDEGVYLCNVQQKSVKKYLDWFYELRITPTNPAYTNKKKDKFYFGHQFLGRDKPQFFSFKLSQQGDNEGRIEFQEETDE